MTTAEQDVVRESEQRAEAVVGQASLVPVWLTWTPLICACLTIALLVIIRRAVRVNEFAVPPVRAPLESTFDAAALTMASARINWASAILLSAVVMILIAGPSVLAILRSNWPSRAKWGCGAITVTIPLIIVLFPQIVISSSHDLEMSAVRAATNFSPKGTFVTFLAGLYGTAFLLTVGLVSELQSANAAGVSVQRLVSVRRMVRDALGITAAWLVVGVIGIGLFHRMTRTCLGTAGLAEFDAATTSSTIFAASFFSALIAGTFLPAELVLREFANAVAERIHGNDVPKTEEWLRINGFGLSVPKVFTNTIAVLAPLLAGVLQNLVKVP